MNLMTNFTQPSPAAQAVLDAFDDDAACDTIRRALEQLDD